MTPREEQFERFCRIVLESGRIPTPKVMFFWGFGNRRNLRGNYVKIRTRLLEEYGYTKNEMKGRWEKTDAGR